MNEELSLLKTELEKTRNVLRVQRLRYQQLVTLFSVKIQEKEEETRTQLQTKHVQLTKILRSLYILESRLRKEQRVLRNVLSERDSLIKTQEIEIFKLKNELSKLIDRCVCGCITATDVGDQSKNSDPASTMTTTTTTTLPAVPNKPDLISSIGIERQHSPPQHQHRLVDASRSNSGDGGDDGAFHIPSLDHYDASLTSLSVLDDRPNSSSSNGDINARKEAGDVVDNRRRLQNERHKFKMKDVGGNAFRNHSPCKILREVTNNPDEKLNGPILHCVRQILGQQTVITDRRVNGDCGGYDEAKCDSKRVAINGNLTTSFSGKPPLKPLKKYDTIASYETNVPTSKEFLPPNPTLTVKPLPKMLTCTDDRLVNEKNFSQSKWTSNGVDGSVLHDTYPIAVTVANNRIDRTKNSPIAVASFADGIDKVTNDESKIVQTVSALLSDSAESEDENSVEMPPTVSQMVKKFEELKREKVNASKQTNTDVSVQLQMANSQTDCVVFQTNFEEFHLVDREIESTCEELDKDKKTVADAAKTIVTVLRLEAEGEENKSTSSTVIETGGCLGAAKVSGGAGTGGAKYETFLEMTGLTQKSILTPSRILSNHRNVMKPKDVKYRSRVKAAVTNEKCANGYAGVATSPTVKYWTEPFL